MTFRPALPLLAALPFALIAGCDESLPRHAKSPEPPDAAPVAEAKPEPSGERDPQAPATYSVRLDTTEGPVTIEVTRAWAPRGADRFHRLVKEGFYDGAKFFRVVEGFVVQFGMAGDPTLNAKWRDATIPDDKPAETNAPGTVTFATSGENSRTTQIFINLEDNSRLDAMGFAPFGRVVEGMDVVKKFYAGYGEGPPNGNGPSQARIQNEGNKYLDAEFKELDAITDARIVSENGTPVEEPAPAENAAPAAEAKPE